MTIRTRIAPSPTGDPHVGTAYIALFNLCFAKQQGGQFVLRIEDTDRARSSKISEEKIFTALRWLGLEWDEGPDVGGPFGPYRQSERLAIYKQYAEQLVEAGHAFYCFRTPQELEQIREEQRAQGLNPGFKMETPELPEAEVKRRIAAGEPYVIRMKTPMEGVCRVPDMLRGVVEIDWSQVDMQILLKSDGMPTYHLANVVDDHLMEITHIIRGEEWISSAPKHLLLYEYLGWEPPQLCHMPLLRNPDKSKLSKRKNPTSILFYQRMGYLPEAVLNYLGRMGWSMPDEREKFKLSEMIKHFDLSRVSLGGPVFDVEKLNWLNASWIREDLSLEDFAQRVQDWALNKNYLMQVAEQAKDRIEILSDLGSKTAFFFSGLPELTVDQFSTLKLENETIRQILQFVQWRLEALDDWTRENIEAALQTLAAGMKLKMKDFMSPIFLAVSGQRVSTPVIQAMATLGPDIARARIRHALNVMGGISKKENKKWQKVYEDFNG